MASSCPSSGDDDDGAAAVLCCMCGDRGVPRELFRCKLCRLRLQHRYCSELYPRVAEYRRCNWYLREDGVGGSPTAEKRSMSTAASDQMTSGTDEDNSNGWHSRSALSAKPGKPVKKPRLTCDEKAAALPEAAETTKSRKPQAASGKSRLKVKARRYKLLAEVISC